MAKEKFDRKKTNFTIGVIGHVEYGKTSLIEAIRKTLNARNLIVDVKKFDNIKSLEVETQGLTKNSTNVDVETSNRHYVFVDAQKRDGYVINMVTNAVKMDCVILVVDVTTGIDSKIKECILLAHKVGVSNLVVFLDKVDRMDDEKLLELVEIEVRELLSKYEFDGDKVPLIRGSVCGALKGGAVWQDEIIELMKACDNSFVTVQSSADESFLMAIDDVYEIAGRGVIATGCVERGFIRLNDKVERIGLGETAQYVVTGIEISNKLLDIAQVGDYVGILLRGAQKKDLERGVVLAAPNTVKAYSEFDAEISVLSKKEGGSFDLLLNGWQARFSFRTAIVAGTIYLQENAKSVNSSTIINVHVSLDTSVVIENGLRFVIREGSRSVGSGIVTYVQQNNRDRFDRYLPHCSIGTLGLKECDATALADIIIKTQKSRNFAGGITNADYVEFTTANRHYSFTNYLSYGDYVKRVATGKGSFLDGAIIFVDATDKKALCARNQILLAQKIGIKNLIVFINDAKLAVKKIDFELVKKRIRFSLIDCKFDDQNIPVVYGSILSENFENYDPTKNVTKLLDACDRYIPLPLRDVDKPFLMSIEDVFSFVGRGTVVSGRIERGVVHEKETVERVGFGKTDSIVITSIEKNNEELTCAQAGDNVGLLIKDGQRTEFARGQVLALPKSVTEYNHFNAYIYVYTKAEIGKNVSIANGSRFLFRIRSASVEGEVLLPNWSGNLNSGEVSSVDVVLSTSLAIEENLHFSIYDGDCVVAVGFVAGTNAISMNGFPTDISAARPLILFPLRLETSFRWININGKKQKQLRVRIIPDDLMLDYKKNAKLTADEVEDGKFFWIQWYIASGCEKYEKEAWDVLCSKYPSYKAAWICDALRPVLFEKIRKGGDWFYRRPYVNHSSENVEQSGIEYIEEKCQEIYDFISQLNDDENVNFVNSADEETGFERFIRTKLGKINSLIFDIESQLQSCEKIVDYLYEVIHEAFVYLQNYLLKYVGVYDKNLKLRTSRPMELWDSDYSVLTSLIEKVEQYLELLDHRRISLSDMVELYHKENKVEFSYDGETRDSNKPIVPVCRCLPDKFALVAKVGDRDNSVVYAVSNRVNASEIQMGFNFDTKDMKDDLDFDTNGELNLEDKMKWLTDYEVAEKNGMAITVNVDDNITKFKYIYVFGVQSSRDTSVLRDLFYGHNYVNSDMRIVTAGTPTNLVDEEYVDEEELQKDQRYELEVGKAYKNFPRVFDTERNIMQNLNGLQAEYYALKDKYSERFSSASSFPALNDFLLTDTTFKSELYPEKDSYLDDFDSFEKVFLSIAADDDEKCELKKELEPLKTYFENLRNIHFNESDYDARKIAFLLKSSGNEYCENNEILNGWGRVVGADARQSAHTKIAFEALWENIIGTVDKNGKFTESGIWQIAIPRDSLLENFLFLKNFFLNHVRARGNVAAFRVENMPYGILPTSDFKEIKKFLRASSDSEDEKVYKLLNLLIELANRWKEARIKNVVCSEKIKGNEAQTQYLNMAGQTPYSVDFVERILVGFSGGIRPKTNVENVSIFDFLNCAYCNKIPVANLFKESDKPDDKNDCLDTFKKMVKYVQDALKENGVSSEQSTNEAKMFVAEFLDLFTHRIDAWFYGIIDYYYHKKLRTVDAGYIGAFGWIFDLKEDKEKKDLVDNCEDVVKRMELSKETPVYKPPKDAHFIMAPSLQHALSAAVLRSSFIKSKKQQDDADYQMCVNLSSARVRQALRLAEGVKSGMSLSIILGSDFERYLHEAYLVYNKDGNGRNVNLEMDQFIYPLRQYFPQLTQINAENEQANDYVMQVVNGEALLNSFVEDWGWNGTVSAWLELNSDKCDWLKELDFSNDEWVAKEQKNCLFKIIERLMDSYDALNDLLLSEGVHRLIMGDKSSYYAVSRFLATGEGNLPEMDILNIPSEHVVVSHKAGVLLPQTSGTPDKVMCLAEPALNAWIEQQFDGMNNILVFVRIGEDSAGEVMNCSLADLGVCGIEYVYLSAYEESFRAYLEIRFRKIHRFYTEKVTILDSAIDAGFRCSGKQVSLDDNRLRLETVRNLIARSRAMNAADWCDQECDGKTENDLIDLNDLESRFLMSKATLDCLKNAINDWKERADRGGKVFNDNLVFEAYELLCCCYESGLVNCFSRYDISTFVGELDELSNLVEYNKIYDAQQDLRKNIEHALTDLEKRMNDANALLESKTAAESGKNAENYIAALQTITLSNFKVLYKFKAENFVGAFSKPLKDSFSFYNNVSVDSFDQWQDEVAEVREGIKLMHQFNMTQLALDHELDKVAIIQTIVPENKEQSNYETDYKHWLGAEVKDESELRDADSLVLYKSVAFKPDTSCNWSGFIFDSWIEYIPYKKHDAGLAFHNDWPDNEAPQTILVAWHPRLPVLQNSYDGYWDWKTLLQILSATRFMMMNRALEPDHIYNDEILSEIFPLTPHYMPKPELKKE